MALRDEIMVILREELGVGFESATLAALCKEYTVRAILPKVKARRVAALDMTALLAARQDKEKALRNEELAREQAIKQVIADTDAQVGGVEWVV